MDIFKKLNFKKKELDIEQVNLQADMTATVIRKGQLTYLYSSEMPSLKLQKGKGTSEIEVNISSAQDDDEALLHKLLTRVRS